MGTLRVLTGPGLTCGIACSSQQALIKGLFLSCSTIENNRDYRTHNRTPNHYYQPSIPIVMTTGLTLSIQQNLFMSFFQCRNYKAQNWEGVFFWYFSLFLRTLGFLFSSFSPFFLF